MRDRYAARRLMLDTIKLGRGCFDCGYNKNSVALHFDHRPGETKTTEINLLMTSGRSDEALLAEIAKCDVVCANCHAIRTVDRKVARYWQTGQLQLVFTWSPSLTGQPLS